MRGFILFGVGGLYRVLSVAGLFCILGRFYWLLFLWGAVRCVIIVGEMGSWVIFRCGCVFMVVGGRFAGGGVVGDVLCG